MATRARSRSGARIGPARVAETMATVLLLALAVAAARDFRVDAVRDFRFTWGTWGAAVAFAFAAGATLSTVVTLPTRAIVVAPALVVAAIVLIHLPAVLGGGIGLHLWDVLATTSFADRTGPQLLAAVVAGAGVARIAAGTRGSVRRRGRQSVE